jgi:hypothetical protein
MVLVTDVVYGLAQHARYKALPNVASQRLPMFSVPERKQGLCQLQITWFVMSGRKPRQDMDEPIFGAIGNGLVRRRATQ